MSVDTVQHTELPPLKGYHRTPFGFYVSDHKSPSRKTRDQTFEWLYRDGTEPISNTYWSMVATLPTKELEGIDNPDIREETRKAQELMLERPAQFVGLSIRGNKVLEEPHGFGVHILDKHLVTGDIEIYNHDIRKIKLGQPQDKYNHAKLWIYGKAKEDDVRFAVRGGDWDAYGGCFGVVLDYGPRNSNPIVTGLGFRSGNTNQAYFDVHDALDELVQAEQLIQRAKRKLM